jgi:hypothetical protein
MKKILSLMAVIVAVFAFTPIETQAGELYRSRIHSNCGHCGNNVLAFYQPIRTIATRSIYGWVPRYHSACGLSGNGYGSGLGFRSRYGAPNSYNYGYGAGVVRRTAPLIEIQRSHLSGRAISTYPGWRYSGLNRCR